MAKVAVNVAVLLLLFAVVAQARFSLDLEKKAINEETKIVIPEADSKPSATNLLLLPSQKPENEIETELDTAGIVDLDLEAAEARLTEPETLEGESSTIDSSAVEATEPEDHDSGSDGDSNSITVISFRPMNGHFRRLPFPFHRRGHRCHHGHMSRTEEGQRVHSRASGYGNDMILSEEGMKFDTVLRDRERLVPGRLMRFHNGDDMRMHQHRFGKHEEMHHEHDHHEYHEHDHHEHEHHEHGHHEHEHHEHGHHEHGNGFMRKLRKFLTNF